MIPFPYFGKCRKQRFAGPFPWFPVIVVFKARTSEKDPQLVGPFPPAEPPCHIGFPIGIASAEENQNPILFNALRIVILRYAEVDGDDPVGGSFGPYLYRIDMGRAGVTRQEYFEQ